jgi:hypothetical protein
MLITINNSAEIQNVWDKIGFYCKQAKLINRTLVVDSILTIEETKEILKEFDIKIRKLPTSYKFSPDQ